MVFQHQVMKLEAQEAEAALALLDKTQQVVTEVMEVME